MLLHPTTESRITQKPCKQDGITFGCAEKEVYWITFRKPENVMWENGCYSSAIYSDSSALIHERWALWKQWPQNQDWKSAFSSEEWPTGHWALAWGERGNEVAPGNESLCQPSPLFSLYYSWVWHSNPLILITKPGNMETDFNLLLIYCSWLAMKHYVVNWIALQLKYLFLCT